MALTIFALILILAMLISVLSRKGMIVGSLQDVLVASGSFGPALLFFIMVGENYTTGTLLGAPGSIYSKGASYGFWFIPYILLAYSVSYFLSPAIWRLGRLSKGATVGDILSWRFNSRLVEVAIAICAMVFLIPTIQIQLTALAIVFEHLNLDITFTQGVIISIILAFIMILISGIRAPAYVSILKDTLLLIAICVVGWICISKTEGGILGLFTTIAAKTPEMLTVPSIKSLPFTMSTVFFQMLTLNIYPILVAGTLTSASEKNIRRSVIIMPLYMLMFPFLVIAAYFALLELPGLAVPDSAVLAIALKYLPPWLLGLIAGGIALTGVLVISVNALAIAGLFSKNILKVIKPEASQTSLILSVRIITALSLIIGGIMTLYNPTLLATVLIISYSGMAQILIAFVFAFFWKRGTSQGIVSGMVAGLAVLIIMLTFKLDFLSLNLGFCALVVNAAVATIVSFLTRPSPGAIDHFLEYVQTKPNSL